MGSHPHDPLRKITAEVLAPIWARRDIPTERIAKALGVSRQAVSLKAKSLGLPSRAGNQECNKLLSDDEFRRMWNEGLGTKEMALLAGYKHHSAISHRARLLGLPKRVREPGAGVKNGRGRAGWAGTLCIEQWREREIARLMGLAS